MLPLLLCLISCLGVPGSAAAREVFVQRTNWREVDPSAAAEDRSAALNAAINDLRAEGGGTVFLRAGTYYLDRPLVIETEGVGKQQSNPMHVRLLGAAPIESHAQRAGETTLVWRGAADAAVIDVRHAQNPTLENLRIVADAGRRFKYGVFFHRTYSALSGTSQQGPPTMLNLIDSGIGPGQGAFTVGVRFNNASEDPSIDQNVDLNYIENLYISGATDDEVHNAAGVWIDGTQVQAQYFRNLHVDRCGTGVFVRGGALTVVGGTFSNNRQTRARNNLSEGGDFVYRTTYTAGHLIQGIRSSGSYRFYTSFYEGQDDLQHDFPVAIAIVGCEVSSLHPDNTTGDAIYSRGSGGPISLAGCTFGQPGGPPLVVRQGQWTQGSIVISDCKFNHAASPFFLRPFDAATTRGEAPKVSLVGSSGYSAAVQAYVPLADQHTDPADARYRHRPFRWTPPRSPAARPTPRGDYAVNLGAPFTYQGATYKARGNYEDYDNGPVINAAIQKILAEAPGGSGTVWFPSGAYVVKSTIELRGARGVRLLGVGGRGGLGFDGVEPAKGSALIWNGPTGSGSTMILVQRSQDITLQGLALSTYDGPGGRGATTIDRFVHISSAGASGYPTQDIWIEDVDADWLSGDVGRRDVGVCQRMVHLGDGTPESGAARVTLLRVQVRHALSEGVLLDGGASADTELLLYTAPISRRAVRATAAGGAFLWIGGGAGANDGQYTDPVVVELGRLSAATYLGGLEVQDSVPLRVLRTSRARSEQPLSLYAVHAFLFSPADQKMLDIRWGGAPQVFLLGSRIGLQPTRVAQRSGTLHSLGNFLHAALPALPWLPSPQAEIQDMGSRVADSAHERWPFFSGNLKYHSATYGSYSLSPLRIRRGRTFHVTWRAARRDGARAGDRAALYKDESSPVDEPLCSVALRRGAGGWAAAGTTRGTLRAPAAAGTYELRYIKGDGTVVYRSPLRVD
jgi:hypothetical protein